MLAFLSHACYHFINVYKMYLKFNFNDIGEIMELQSFNPWWRDGKITLMYQIIDDLLRKGVNPYNILYFSFDEMRYDLEDIIKQYETEVLREDIAKKRVFILLDEIQKLKGWPSKVK